VNGVIGNAVGYQGVWLVSVYAAGRGLPWPGLIAAVGFAGWQLAVSRERASDLRLLPVAALLGVLIDGTLTRSGAMSFAATAPALPVGGAPLWILGLWCAFCLTLNHSLGWLRDQPVLAALLGAVGGPLSYLAAHRMAGAVTLAAPQWRVLAWLALSWAVALLALTRLASHWARGPGAHRPSLAAR
jgi:hypothetical protein